MSKISDISQEYKTKIEAAKKADIDARYNEHYISVVQPHVKELDDTYNKCVSELKQRLNDEKQAYISEQRMCIEQQVEGEYAALLSAIETFIEPKEG